MPKKNNTAKQALKIIIVGCGKVGTTLVEQLSKEGNSITIIDNNARKIQSITSLYDVMGIVGNGASYSVQTEAGIKDTDLLIAVTESDELNLLCCTVAKRSSNCSVIARVRTPDYNNDAAYLREKLGLAMIINPELEAAREISRVLLLPSALEVTSFAHGQAELIKVKVPDNSMLNGMEIYRISKETSVNTLICAVERDGEVYIPSGSFVVKSGDIISFVAKRRTSRLFLKDIGLGSNKVKNIMIIGGGKASYYLATLLINMGISVKIIERDPAKCEELSILLPKAIIINGDGTDEDLLKEEGIENVESFVALTGIDEENVMLSLYTMHVSKAKVVTTINKINFKGVISSLDLGSKVYPRYISAEAIIAYARAKRNSMNSNIETLSHMYDSRVEAIEFCVSEESTVTNTPLKDLTLKKNLLVSFINRNGEIIIPTGNDYIKVGDTVMIVTTYTGFSDIKDILA